MYNHAHKYTNQIMDKMHFWYLGLEVDVYLVPEVSKDTLCFGPSYQNSSKWSLI